MKIHHINLYQEFNAPIEQVWEAFSDHANFGKMMGQNIKRIIDSANANNINGIGSVRLLTLPTGNLEETITRSEKPNLIEYKISKGTPLHHHYGIMNFSSLPDGRSAINYAIDLGSKYPLIGGIVKMIIQRGIAGGMKNYARRLQNIS